MWMPASVPEGDSLSEVKVSVLSIQPKQRIRRWRADKNLKEGLSYLSLSVCVAGLMDSTGKQLQEVLSHVTETLVACAAGTMNST